MFWCLHPVSDITGQNCNVQNRKILLQRTSGGQVKFRGRMCQYDETKKANWDPVCTGIISYWDLGFLYVLFVFFFFLKGNCPVYLQYMYMYMLKLLIDPTHFLLPSGNQTCQWKITHLYTNYVPIKTSFYRGFNIATFDYRRVCPLFPIILGELWWPHVMSRRETAIFRLVHNYDSAKIPVISLLFLYLYIIYICISHFLHHWLI